MKMILKRTFGIGTMIVVTFRFVLKRNEFLIVPERNIMGIERNKGTWKGNSEHERLL
jgi:hypothetical protein